MKVIIQGYWNAEVKTLESSLNPEEMIEKYKLITIATIIIDEKVFADVEWDGKELTLKKSEPRGTHLSKNHKP